MPLSLNDQITITEHQYKMTKELEPDSKWKIEWLHDVLTTLYAVRLANPDQASNDGPEIRIIQLFEPDGE